MNTSYWCLDPKLGYWGIVHIKNGMAHANYRPYTKVTGWSWDAFLVYAKANEWTVEPYGG